MTKPQKPQSGFTLIESIVYLALFAMVIGGGMVATYQIIEATGSARSHIIINQEANFLLKKIDWALRGSTAVAVSGSTLTVTKDSTELVFSKNGANNMLKRGAGAAIQLNSSNVSVDSISFLETEGSHGIPGSLQITLMLTSGKTTQAFSTTQYLR